MSETAIFPFLFLYENVDVEWCIAVFNRYILYLISILKVITISLGWNNQNDQIVSYINIKGNHNQGNIIERKFSLYLISILKVITMS